MTVVVFSGGMDSTTLLADTIHREGTPDHVRAVSFDYGQRHGTAELAAAKTITGHLRVAHDIIDLSVLAAHLTGSALTDDSVDVPDGHYAAETMVATVVPNRNLIMLSVAAGIAAARGHRFVATAVHAGDHFIYADCRPEFIDAARAAIYAGTNHKIGLMAPYVDITKTDIVRRAAEIGAPLDLSWSCYKGGRVHCARCGTCVERIEAFALAGQEDPTEYADPDHAEAIRRDGALDATKGR